MRDAGWLCLAVVAAYSVALSLPLVQAWLGRRAGGIAGWCSVPLVMACPALIPAPSIGLRAAAMFLSGDIAFKVVESMRRGRGRAPRMSLGEYYRFLIPFPALSIIYPDFKRRLAHCADPWPDVLRLLAGTAGVIVAILTTVALSHLEAVRSSFALNHAMMLMAFVVAIESLSRALCGLERLAGFDTAPPIQNAYLSRSVSEFWHRYNYRVHDWLYQNVFLVTGGRRAPVRSVLLVFLISGISHEAGFAIATSRLTGYQFAFFTIQGPGALLSRRLERLARRGGILGKVVAHGATILFMAATSVLFFHGVSKVFPFIYASESPLP